MMPIDPISSRYGRINKQVHHSTTLLPVLPYNLWSVGAYIQFAMFRRPLGALLAQLIPRSARRRDHGLIRQGTGRRNVRTQGTTYNRATNSSAERYGKPKLAGRCLESAGRNLRDNATMASRSHRLASIGSREGQRQDAEESREPLESIEKEDRRYVITSRLPKRISRIVDCIGKILCSHQTSSTSRRSQKTAV